MKRFAIALTVMLLISVRADAAVTTYGNLGPWLAAIGGPPTFFENFQSNGTVGFDTINPMTFDGFTATKVGQTQFFDGVAGGLSIGPFTGALRTQLDRNGLFNPGATPTRMRLTFDDPIQSGGALYFRAPGSPLVRVRLTFSDFSFETFSIPTGLNFRGFTLDPGESILFADYFTPSDATVGTEGTLNILSMAGTTFVPVPAAALMALPIFAGLIIARRRRMA